jgi:hypothetical protein
VTRWRQTDFEGMLLFVGANVRPGSDVERAQEIVRESPDDPYLMQVLVLDHEGGGEIRIGYTLEPVPDRPGSYRTTFYVREDPFR